MKILWLITSILLTSAIHADVKEASPSVEVIEVKEKKDRNELVANHTDFTFSLFPYLDPEDRTNVIFSPYSIATGLEMAFIGARGKTADEIQSTLELTLDRTQLSHAAAQLATEIFPPKEQADALSIKSVNSLWLKEQFFVLSDYSHTIESAFQAKVFRINFEPPEEAAKKINQWVLDNTNGKIGPLVSSNDLPEETRLILINALYLSEKWAHPFDPKMTQSAKFHPTDETNATIQMMTQTGYFPYYENDLLQMLALPFAASTNPQKACVILLPRSSANFSQMQSELSSSWTEWLSGLQNTHIQLQLPRFTLNKRFHLNAALQAMGLKIPFTTQANFAGIDGKLDLYLSQVIHQAYFALNEFGVDAAAATAVQMQTTSIRDPETPIGFTADHPFFVFIVDIKTQEILFMGKFQEPKDIQ